MRYSRQHKQTARQHLVDRGGSHAKKHGFGGSGMDALAAAAGVTTGSLYRHFDGKSELFAAIVGNELEQSAERFSALAGEGRAAVLRMLDRYLSMSHVEHPERGCVLPTLTAEVARADEPVRAAFQGGIERIHAVLERVTDSGDDAWVLLAQMVGAVMLARALPDEPARQRLLAAVRRSGRTIIESA